jgi:hypothetical protein
VDVVSSGEELVDSWLCAIVGTAGTLRGRFSSLIDGRLDLELEPTEKSTWPYTNDLSAVVRTSEPLRCQSVS